MLLTLTVDFHSDKYLHVKNLSGVVNFYMIPVVENASADI